MKESIQVKDYLILIKEWIKGLKSDELEKVSKQLDRGTMEFISFLEENYEGISEEVNKLVDDIEQLIMGGKNDEELLNHFDLDLIFLKKLIPEIRDSLRIFFDSQILRDLSLEDFKVMVTHIVTCVFINRESRIPEDLPETIAHIDDENVIKATMIIKHILIQFYGQNVSYNDLHEVFLNQLHLKEEYSKEAIQIFKENNINGGLDRFFYFEHLKMITRSLNEISASQEEEH